MILGWLKLRTRSEFLSICTRKVENVLSSKQIRLHGDWFLDLIDGILFNGSKITGGRRITLIEFTRLVKALMTHNFLRLRFLFFAGHPLDKKGRVVAGQKVVVEVLLHKVGGYEVLESDQSIVTFIRDYHSGHLAKGRKDLINLG